MHSELSEIENNKDILSQKTRKDLSNLKQLFVTNQIFLKELRSCCSVLDKKKKHTKKHSWLKLLTLQRKFYKS